MKKKPVNRANWRDKTDSPPPSIADLTFQNDSWNLRYPSAKKLHISPAAMNSLFADKTLTWELGKEIEGAGEVLENE